MPRDHDDRTMRALLERREGAAPSESITDNLAVAQLELIVCSVEELPLLTETSSGAFMPFRLVGNEDLAVFQNAGVTLVQKSQALIWRVKLASILVQIQQDPLLAKGSIGHLAKASAGGQSAFQSASGLFSGLYILDAYFGPCSVR